jgi:hypothetical protein
MKKLSLLSNLAMVLGLSILIVSCTKQQDAVVADTPTDAAVIKNIAGGDFHGKISRSDAEEMSKTYKAKAAAGATEYVAFKIADLQAYLATLQAKGKTDLVNVTFAVYDEKTAPDPSLVGRTTIEFGSGAPKSRTRDNRGNAYTGFGVMIFDDNADYMNHGQIWP